MAAGGGGGEDGRRFWGGLGGLGGKRTYILQSAGGSEFSQNVSDPKNRSFKWLASLGRRLSWNNRLPKSVSVSN